MPEVFRRTEKLSPSQKIFLADKLAFAEILL